jgi:hypothetical protein
MEKLYEYTIKKQQLKFEAELAKRDAQMAEMAAKLEMLSAASGAAPSSAPESPLEIIPATRDPRTGALTQVDARVMRVSNKTYIQNVNQMNVMSFDGKERFRIPVSLVKAAFTENPMLREYCSMTDEERTNADKAAPYVLEALVDLVRRAHQDPINRNIYLNPNRADQVMVCVDDDDDPQKSKVQNWEVRPLIIAIRTLFNGIAEIIHRIIVTDRDRAELPLDVQSAASWVPSLYRYEPERFVRDGKAPISAHLANVGRDFNIMSLVVPK